MPNILLFFKIVTSFFKRNVVNNYSFANSVFPIRMHYTEYVKEDYFPQRDVVILEPTTLDLLCLTKKHSVKSILEKIGIIYSDKWNLSEHSLRVLDSMVTEKHSCLDVMHDNIILLPAYSNKSTVSGKKLVLCIEFVADEWYLKHLTEDEVLQKGVYIAVLYGKK